MLGQNSKLRNVFDGRTLVTSKILTCGGREAYKELTDIDRDEEPYARAKASQKPVYDLFGKNWN